VHEARAARDDALERVERNADKAWKLRTMVVVMRLATDRETLTTDDVWERLQQHEERTHEPRALGAVMRTAAKRGYIRPTDDYTTSVRKECHARPVRVWQSLIHRH